LTAPQSLYGQAKHPKRKHIEEQVVEAAVQKSVTD